MTTTRNSKPNRNRPKLKNSLPFVLKMPGSDSSARAIIARSATYNSAWPSYTGKASNRKKLLKLSTPIFLRKRMLSEAHFVQLAELSPNSTKSPASGKSSSLKQKKENLNKNSVELGELKPWQSQRELPGRTGLTWLDRSLSHCLQANLLQQSLLIARIKSSSKVFSSNSSRVVFRRVLIFFSLHLLTTSRQSLRWWIVAAIPLGIAGLVRAVDLLAVWQWWLLCLLSLSLSRLRSRSTLSAFFLLPRMLLLSPVPLWSEDATKKARTYFD